jgi:RNA polymerase sigma factor (sigma-70 family)
MTALSDAAMPSADDRPFEELYEEQFDFLVGVAVRKFRVPESEAESLAQDVFLSYLRHRPTIREVYRWLLGAICHASRYYWRQHGRLADSLDPEEVTERPDPESMHILESLPNQLAARQALEGLSERDQMILRLRYFDGCSIHEVAARLGVKPKYAQKLVTKCLRRAELQYNARGQKR